MGARGDCRVCRLNNVAALEARIASGESVLKVARESGIPKSTLHLHWKVCRKYGKKAASIPPPVSQEDTPLDASLLAPMALPQLPADDPRAGALAELVRVHAIAQESYKRAHESRDDRAIAMLVQQLRMNVVKAIEIAMKGRREDKDPVERLMENPEFAAASRVLFGVLESFPEARAAVLERLAEWIGGEA